MKSVKFHVTAPRWRGALGFGVGGLALLLPPLLALFSLPPWGVTMGGFGFSLTVMISTASFGLCGLAGAVALGLNRVIRLAWAGIFLLVLPLQWTLTHLLAQAFLEQYPAWVAWSLVAIPQVLALAIVGTAAGFVAEGGATATWGGRAMAISGGVLYLTFLFNSWLGPEVAGWWPQLIAERVLAFGLGGWVFGYGMERVSQLRRKSILKAAAGRH